MRDARGSLKSARSEKGTIKRIQAERLIAALLQRTRQSAVDVTGSDPCHGCCKPSERSNREAGEHIVFGEPAWSADALHEKLARLAIERLKMSMIPGRHIDPGRYGDVKARFVVQQDDMWKLARWMAAGVGSLRHVPTRTPSRIEISARGQFVNCLYPRPRKFRDVASAFEILVEPGRPKQRHSNECRSRYRESSEARLGDSRDIGPAARR